MDPKDGLISVDERNQFHGHHVELGTVSPQWQFSIPIVRPPESCLRFVHLQWARW